MEKRFALSVLLTAVLFMFTQVSFAESDNDDDHFSKERDRLVAEMQDKMKCIKRSKNWDDVEDCHERAERMQKKRRLKELKEEQRRLEEELEQEHD